MLPRASRPEPWPGGALGTRPEPGAVPRASRAPLVIGRPRARVEPPASACGAAGGRCAGTHDLDRSTCDRTCWIARADAVRCSARCRAGGPAPRSRRSRCRAARHRPVLANRACSPRSPPGETPSGGLAARPGPRSPAPPPRSVAPPRWAWPSWSSVTPTAVSSARSAACRGWWLIVLGVLFAWSFLLNRTRFGRDAHAIGSNAEAARRRRQPGRDPDRVLRPGRPTAGVGGIVYASQLRSVSSGTDGATLVLYAVAAAVIGGTSLFGGRGKPLARGTRRHRHRGHLQRHLPARDERRGAGPDLRPGAAGRGERGRAGPPGAGQPPGADPGRAPGFP